ncbi:MAG: arabinose operon transcriptional regulator AraC [Planctomycetes bacterium]|nr:arabinose operon transcriptional regulator AraC [Planctomycetota bacterium]
MKKPAVVSFNAELMAGRTVIDRADHGVVWREHGMDGWILNYTADGRGRINRGERRFSCGPGQLLLFKPGVAHDYAADQEPGRWTHLWVYFFPRAHWFEWLTWREASPGILTLDTSGEDLQEARGRIVALFEEVLVLAHSPHRRRVPLAMSALEQLLLWCDTVNPESAHANLDPRIQLAIARLCARADHPQRLAEIARTCGMSSSRLSHLFREQLGTTPMRYLESHRMNQARELLLMTGRSIGAIAEEVGFADAVWFTRVFRRHVGVSPRAFRRDPAAADAGRAALAAEERRQATRKTV